MKAKNTLISLILLGFSMVATANPVINCSEGSQPGSARHSIQTYWSGGSAVGKRAIRVQDPSQSPAITRQIQFDYIPADMNDGRSNILVATFLSPVDMNGTYDSFGFSGQVQVNDPFSGIQLTSFRRNSGAVISMNLYCWVTEY